jgi:hypothetical protein
MSLPTKSDIQELSFSKNGGPWVRVASKSSQDADGLSYSKDGTPFWFIEDGVVVEEAKIRINILNTWKDVASVKINVGDSWKDVESIKINVGDTWKDIL